MLTLPRRVAAWSARLSAVVLSVLWTASAVPAWACGGFFCFTQPVDQSGERILYVQQKDKIDLHIQISYAGDDENFSWVLPLAKMPEQQPNQQFLATGSDSVFQLLETATAPRFQLNWKYGSGCNPPMCPMAASDNSGGGGGGKGGGGGVQVLAQDSVGPYDYAILKGTSGEEIVQWLNDNKYNQPKATVPLVQSYAKQDYVFVALKLKKDKGAGDLVPVTLTIPEPSPCLPIRLTALATQPDMPIIAWVLGQARAIPKNYLHIELNEAAIDWTSNGGNYKTVVSKAVDQGSGHAFLTEYARKTQDVPMQFAQPGWSALAFDGITAPGAFLQKMMELGVPRNQATQNLIKKYMKKGEQFAKVSDQEFYGCIQNAPPTTQDEPCKGYLAAVLAAGFDAEALAKDLEDQVFKPLQALQAQYKTLPYLTRLFTTMSAEEMDKDPVFAINADLPDVDNQHVAEAQAICENGATMANKVQLTFKDGFKLTLPVKDDMTWCGGFGPQGRAASGFTDTGALVAAGGQPLAKLQVIDEKGAPVDIHPSWADKVDAQLNLAKLGEPSLPAGFLDGMPKGGWNPHSANPLASSGGATVAAAPDDGGCSAGGVGHPAALTALLAAAGLLVARRRKDP
jgi:uncharacterized protein (TIGR03382 family)